MASLFEECVLEISDFYTGKGLEKGWRFLYGPKDTLKNNNGMLLIGLNPGGSNFEEPSPSVERGNAYRMEKWATRKYNRLRLFILTPLV